MAPRQGTGFTNINRVLQANRGSKLGGAVSGGITGQVQNVQSGIKSAQDQFQEEANKNRLDTDENKAQRQGVLNKFDPTKNAPDTTNFLPSSGLTTKYQTEKTAFQKQQEDSQKQYQDQEKSRQAELTRLQGLRFKDGMPAQYSLDKAKDRERQKSVRVLNNFSGVAKGAYDAQSADIQSKLGTLDTDYAKKSQAEKDAYIASETEKNALANMPTEDEIKGFNRFATGTYGGPSQLQDSATLLSKAQQAESLGGLARSSGGRQELLRQFVGGRDYTQGQRNLDSTILGRDPSVNLGAAARTTRGAVENVQQASRGASNQALEYVNRAKEFGDETRGMVDQARNPLSATVDQKLLAAQKTETGRKSKFTQIQEMLSGKAAPELHSLVRSGVGLQDLSNSGSLSDSDLSALLGGNGGSGLLQRGTDLGLDVGNLLGERLTDTSAQGLTRAGVASGADAARLNALDRMLGKQGTDLEFLDSRQKLESGKSGIDINSLQEYITRAESQRVAKDPAYAAQLAKTKANNFTGPAVGLAAGAATKYLAQEAAKQAAIKAAGYEIGTAGLASLASGLAPGMGMTTTSGAVLVPGAEAASAQIAANLAASGSLAGGTAAGATAAGATGATTGAAAGAAGGGLGGLSGGPATIAAMLAFDTLTGGDSTAQTAQALGGLGLKGGELMSKGRNEIYKTILSTGGFDDTAAGKKALEALQFYTEQEDRLRAGTGAHLSDWTGSLGDMTSDTMDDIGNLNLSNFAKNYYGVMGGKNAERLASDAGKIFGIKGGSLNNLGKDIKTSLFGGKTGNWSTDRLSTKDIETGKGVKIGSLANKSSAQLLKQIQYEVEAGKLGKVQDKSKYGTGHQRVNTIMNYYKQAKAREDAETNARNAFYDKYIASDEDLKEDIDYSSNDVQKFMDRIKPASYNYKDEVKDSPLASKNRELGVMAQDLEKSKLGKEAVHDTPQGKIVDYDNLEPKMLASISSLNERLKRIEGKK